jgi:hypothetical protein
LSALSEREALRAFDALKRTPESFRRYLQRCLSYAELGSRAALDDTLGHVFNDSGYRAAWDRLPPADKAVLRALAQDVSDLHSLTARKRLGEELGSGKARSTRYTKKCPPSPAEGGARGETRVRALPDPGRGLCRMAAPARTRGIDPVARVRWGRGGYGAGDGNRTHVSSLGSCSSTIELHPQPALILQEFPHDRESFGRSGGARNGRRL